MASISLSPSVITGFVTIVAAVIAYLLTAGLPTPWNIALTAISVGLTAFIAHEAQIIPTPTSGTGASSTTGTVPPP